MENNTTQMTNGLEVFVKEYKARCIKYVWAGVGYMDQYRKENPRLRSYQYYNAYQNMFGDFARLIEMLDRAVYMIEKEEGVKHEKEFRQIYGWYREDQVEIDKDIEYVLKQIERHVEEKRMALEERIVSKIGKIIDGSNLEIGYDGNINGVIIGERGKATAKTIFAGGYNIQCLHVRFLVKEIQEKK